MSKHLKWTKRRWKQLRDLDRLLTDCERIDSANNVTERLKRIVRAAAALRKCNLKARQSSFMLFLEDIARADDKPAKEPAQ